MRTPWRLGFCLMLLTVSVGAMEAQQPWPLWESFSTHAIDDQGRVIDHSAGDHTTSEGESYAMLFALADDDRKQFATLAAWTEANLAEGDLATHLPAWNWGKAPDGSWRVLDRNSAADADLWIAYALSEAGRLWGVPRYSGKGMALAEHIARQELTTVPALGTTLLPGTAGYHPSAETWYVNPSYLPPQVLTYFAHRAPGSRWAQVAESLPRMLVGHGGFAMDWMSAGSNGLRAETPPTGQASVGSYDAIRVYLWLGMADERTPGVRDELAAMRGMTDYLRRHGGPPERVDATGKVVSIAAPPGFTAATLPFLHTQGMQDEETAEAARLSRTRDPRSGLYGRGDYYDQVLALFATGWREGRIGFEADGRLRVRWKT